MTQQVFASGSTLSSVRREAHNAFRLIARICAIDDVHDDDPPFAAVIATITSPAQGTHEYPRGTWQSMVPLCQECADRLQAGLPFGYFMVDAILPKLCPKCGVLAPCNNSDCDYHAQP